MKAISLHQPWASLLVTRQSPTTVAERTLANMHHLGIPQGMTGSEHPVAPPPMIKKFETRSWPCPPSIIGQHVAFASTKRKPGERHFGEPGTAHWFCDDGLLAYTGTPQLTERLPLGCVVGSGTITASYLIVERNVMGKHEPPFVTINTPTGALSLWREDGANQPWLRIDDQLPYGDYRHGRYAWLIEDAAQTTERCPRCWGGGKVGYEVAISTGDVALHGGRSCGICNGVGRCDPIPVTGRQGFWNWEPR